MSTKKELTPTTQIDIPHAKSDEKQKAYLSNLIENITISNLGSNYYKEDSLFKKRLEKLNFKFYTETEKFLNNKQDMESSQDQLFVILFKQISLYMEENERLNKLLKEREDSDKLNNKDDFHKKEREKYATQQTINFLKASSLNLEKKMSEKIKAEEKMKQEIDSLKRQLKFYKDKLQLEVNVKKTMQTFKKITKISNINSLINDDNLKTEPKIEKEREPPKTEVKSAMANRNVKSAIIDNGKINSLEISINKFKLDNDRLSDNQKKGRKTELLDEVEDGFIINNMEEKNKNNSCKIVQSQSPNKLFSLTIENTSFNKYKQINSVRLPPQKKEIKEVKLITTTQNKIIDHNREKSTITEKCKVEANEAKEILSTINDNIDNELDELMELENELLKLKNGLDQSKVEIKHDPYKSINLESSPTNKKQRNSVVSTPKHKTTLHSVTIDLNTKINS